ncbi:MAG: hypothetical protein JWR09_3860 [Mucilaginibacter sp.]|nr:hypothetical protein [Mucilaginibacter sp.]
MLQQAVERNLEIIGEAVNCLLKIDSEINITSARRMVDTRNKMVMMKYSRNRSGI